MELLNNRVRLVSRKFRWVKSYPVESSAKIKVGVQLDFKLSTG